MIQIESVRVFWTGSDSTNVIDVADAFTTLRLKRNSADYDMATPALLTDAMGAVTQARQ